MGENGVKAILTAAGVAADEARIKGLIAALDGVNIEEAIKAAAAAPTKEEKKEDEESGMAERGARFCRNHSFSFVWRLLYRSVFIEICLDFAVKMPPAVFLQYIFPSCPEKEYSF